MMLEAKHLSYINIPTIDNIKASSDKKIYPQHDIFTVWKISIILYTVFFYHTAYGGTVNIACYMRGENIKK